jgi:alpha-L-arabinofuranosidase
MQAENTIDEPTKIAPVTKEMKISGKTFTYEAEPSSMSVIRIKQG